MYKISVLAMFKNESMIIKDWIEHYLREGVEHFYLIDNGSTDDYYEKIKIYDKYITLTKDSTRLPKGTQTFLFNKIYLETIKKETEWIIFCDIDEYIYARNGNNQIMDVLNKLPENVEKIWLPWKCFGSNGHKNQPNNIINNFSKRKEGYNKNDGFGKIICRTANLERIMTCGHIVRLNKNNIMYNANSQKLEDCNLDEENCQQLNLHLNHYMLMSEEYYLKVKSVRGGGESGLTGKYDINAFYIFDKQHNDLFDNELATKKYSIIIQQKSITISESNNQPNNQSNNKPNNQPIYPFFKQNDKNLFYKYLNKSKYYFEYGSGGTTYQASLNPNIKKIISIESDYEVHNKIKNMITQNKEKITFQYCDMKTLPNTWGNPGKDSTLNDWINYSNQIINLNKNISSNIDLLVIDGRFRVACCLKCYSVINDDCIVIFDDFLNRSYYHIILGYFTIIEQSDDNCMVILKKNKTNIPPIELIKKYEQIKE
jgi:hypothetical protein